MAFRTKHGNGSVKPTAADFAPEAINRAVRSEVLGHPTHLGGWVLALLGGAGMVMLTGPVWIAVTAVGGVAILSSLITNALLRHETLSQKQRLKLLDARRRADKYQADELRLKCGSKGFEDGETEVDELWNAYEALVVLLDENADVNDPESLDYRALADKLYEAGVHNLGRYLDLFVLIKRYDVEKLQDELKARRKERRKARKPADQERLDGAIINFEEQLADAEGSERKFKERLAAANKIERSLLQAAGTLSDLGLGDAAGGNISWSHASDELTGAVQAAVESNEELQELMAG